MVAAKHYRVVCPAPQRAQLLQFCTGSARAPATGFAGLMGYADNPQQFCMQRVRPFAAL